jgi:hypothetical protein
MNFQGARLAATPKLFQFLGPPLKAVTICGYGTKGTRIRS